MTEQIETLRAEAGAAGDSEMVAICDRALDGDEDAILECAEDIDDARAQNDETSADEHWPTHSEWIR